MVGEQAKAEGLSQRGEGERADRRRSLVLYRGLHGKNLKTRLFEHDLRANASALVARKSFLLFRIVLWRFDSGLAKILQAAFDRLSHTAGQCRRSLQATHRQAHDRPEVFDQWIALVFQVEFERFGLEDRRAS